MKTIMTNGASSEKEKKIITFFFLSKSDKTPSMSAGGAKQQGEVSHWVPDEDAISCIGCNDKFSLVKRKHHCRSCGGVFCSACCSKKVTLPHLGFTSHVRVCNNCYRQRMQSAHLAPAKAKVTSPPTPTAATATAATTNSNATKWEEPDGLQSKIYYFANLGREGAEALLAKADDNTFLVRKSTSEVGAWVLSARHAGGAIQHWLVRVRTVQRPDVTDLSKKLVEEYSVDIGGVIRTFPSVEFLADELDLNPLELDEDDSAFEQAAAAAPASSDGNKSPRRIRRDVAATAAGASAASDATAGGAAGAASSPAGAREKRIGAAAAYRLAAAAGDTPTIVEQHLERLAQMANMQVGPPVRGTPLNGDVRCLAAMEPNGLLLPWSYTLSPFGEYDCDVRVEYTGLCRSDIHQIDNDWQMASFPHVPGHEVVGTVIAVGSKVENVRVGDRVGLGAQCGACLGDECRHCAYDCEQLCPHARFTAVSSVGEGASAVPHRGGFASALRTDARFVVPVPPALPLECVAPLLCAGVTVFAPMQRLGVKADSRVAVAGIGGLGHLSVQFAAAIGAHVTAVSASMDKKADAEKMGASDFVYTKDAEAMKRAEDSFDFLFCTVSGAADVSRYVPLLRSNGRLCLLGVVRKPLSLASQRLIFSQISVTGSAGGSRADLHRTLEFAARHNIRPLVEVYPMSAANEAVNRLRDNRARYRIVLQNDQSLDNESES
jgi:D-arabinose 1-dehydrogenase-like Zn-dependent alcohol dehydrogenase